MQGVGWPTSHREPPGVCARTRMETQCALSPLCFLLGGGYLQQGLLLPRTQLLSHLHSLFRSFSLVSTHQTTPLSDIFLPLGILRGSPLHVVMGVDSQTPRA